MQGFFILFQGLDLFLYCQVVRLHSEVFVLKIVQLLLKVGVGAGESHILLSQSVERLVEGVRLRTQLGYFLLQLVKLAADVDVGDVSLLFAQILDILDKSLVEVPDNVTISIINSERIE